jgi:glyoxylase-like metal-dependent hydrolase (beta-lactamase superfamily II)
MAKEIAPGIYRLDIPLKHNPLRNLNSYLILGNTRNLLIDTGFNTPDCLAAMRSELRLLSVDMNKTDIFLTHMHSDHSGLASELATEASKVFISAVDAGLAPERRPEIRRYLTDMYLAEGFPDGALKKSMDSNRSKSLVSGNTVDFTHLGDGSILEYGGYRLNCILTPGHTPGHLCLYCAELKLMVLGDHVLFDITPNIVRWPTFDNALKQYLDHLERIARYDIEIPLPGHRSVSGTVAERANEIAGHHRLRLDEVQEIVRRHPGQTAYGIAAKMHWDIRCDSWDDFPPSQRWFAFGEALAHLDYLLETGDLVREEKDGVRHYTVR